MAEVAWQRNFDGVTVTTVRGDLTAEKVDAIVNAANEQLAHGGGVAGAISKRGGPSIQRESNAWTADHGPVPTGGAAITGAGDLPARFVIHAVGPIWGTGDEFTKLASAVRAALRLADERGCKSISLPAISAGIYGFPVDLCARTFFDAIENWLKERSGGSITVVRLCNIDHATAKAFETEARGRYGP